MISNNINKKRLKICLLEISQWINVCVEGREEFFVHRHIANEEKN